jgi:anaerobic selenocysteine-containing dehydrogenase
VAWRGINSPGSVTYHMKARTFCGKMCGASCGIIVTVEDGRIAKVEGDPDYPPTRGYICAKGRAFPELIYHPDRVTHPMIRVGPRGSGEWRQATKEEALAYIGEKLKTIQAEYGPESIALHRGAHRNDLVTEMLIRLGKSIGTPNIANVDNVCSVVRIFADSYTYGQKSTPDTTQPPECLVVWGRNSLQTGSESMINIFKDAQRHGTKILVVDPKKTSIAEQAEQWLKPRPASDAHLALTIIKTIIEEDLYDRDFVEKWTVGFPQLRELVGGHSFEELSEATWVPVENIKRFARTYAVSKPAVIQTGNPLDQIPDAFQTCRLISMLRAITGNLDVPGGEVMNRPVPLANITDVPDRSRKPMVAAEYRVASAHNITPSQEALKAALTGEPYPIRASIIFGSNPMVTYADTATIKKALLSLDLLVVIDYFETETTRLADVILPASANHEYDDLSPRSGHVNARPKLVDAPGDCESDLQWANLLAKELGVGDLFWGNESEIWNYILKPAGLTYDELKARWTLWAPQSYYKYRSSGFRTPSGKVELYSEKLLSMGISPIPEVGQLPAPTHEYPLLLSSGKDAYSYHSSWRLLPTLRRLSPEPFIELHPEAVCKYELKVDDMAVIETPTGSVTQRIRLNDSIDPRLVYAAPGWGSDANVNNATNSDGKLCPAMGAPQLRGIPCRVRKA